jgi:hypothetical protein
MLSMFAVSTYHLSLIVFEIKYDPRWPPLLKIEISSNGQKLLYFKPESGQRRRYFLNFIPPFF